jgi:D-alanyl-D-alanine dipeptidase
MTLPESNPHAHEVYSEALHQPIPDMTEARRIKSEVGYANIPIDTSDIRFNDAIVTAADYGIAGQNYYSRPNAATGEPVRDIGVSPQLRLSFAEILQDINHRLQDPVITEFFGGEVELYIEDALRPIDLQKYLHDVVFPSLIRKNDPDLQEEDVEKRVSEMIAVGSADPLKPSPHATGGACDVILRFKQDTPEYVAGSEVPMGHVDGETSSRIYPDHFEHNVPQTEDEVLAMRNRRAFYAIMTGKAFGIDTHLAVNPTEFWHHDYGDQLWALGKQESAAFYSIPK